MDLPYSNWVFVKYQLDCPQFANSKYKTVENR